MILKLKTLLLLATLAVAENASGQVVHIQQKAIVLPNQDVHLGDIATISGTDAKTAEMLAGTVVMSSLTGTRTVKAEAILMAVMAQQGPAISNHLQVSGASECEIFVGQGTIQSVSETRFDDSRAMAMTPTHIDSLPPTAPASTPSLPLQSPGQTRDLAVGAEPAVVTAAVIPVSETPNTLTKMITAKIAQDLQAPESDLRITFDTINPAMDEVISGGGQTWRFRALQHPLLGNVQFEANLVDANHAIKKLMVSGHVEKRVTVEVASTDIARGELLTKNQFSLQDVYIDRLMPTVFTKDADVMGLEAQREIAVGAMLDKRDFKAAELVARNDEVTVVCLDGSLQVTVTGRAASNGKLHDVISVKDANTGEVYQATIIGKRLAVVGGVPDEAQEKLLRETH